MRKSSKVWVVGMRKKDKGAKVDYGHYDFMWRETWRYLGQGVLGCILINYVFYKSPWAFILLLPVPAFYLKWMQKQKVIRRRKTLHYQFKDALASLNVAVQAGYSMENAVSACARDMEKLYGKQEDIVKEFHYMEARLGVSVPVEELFQDLGKRSQIEDIENFAAIFATAKRTGGSLPGILQKTARMLGDKIDVKKEIEATLAAKKSEQLIMSIMPFGIILYMQITSPGFLQVLYGNIFGTAAMSVCLGIYFLVYWMGRRIVDIEV